MKIYIVVEADYKRILNEYSFKTRGDAEELILSIAEEDDFVECNYAINRFGDADTLEEYVDLLCDQWNWDKENCSNECVVLYLGGFNYYIRTIPSLED